MARKRVVDFSDLPPDTRWTDPQLMDEIRRQERTAAQREYIRTSRDPFARTARLASLPVGVPVGMAGRIAEGVAGLPERARYVAQTGVIDPETGKPNLASTLLANEVASYAMTGGVPALGFEAGAARSGLGKIPKVAEQSKIEAPAVIRPGTEHPSYQAAAAEVASLNRARDLYQPAQYPKELANLNQFMIKPAPYELRFNPEGQGKFFKGVIQTDEEAALQAALKKATKTASTMPNLFTDKDLIRQPFRFEAVEMPKYAKGTPDWVTQQFPRVEQMARDAFARGQKFGGPNVDKFYWLGKIYEDAKAQFGEAYAQQFMREYGNLMGATTAFARPPQNQRAMGFHHMRQAQGLPVAEAAPFPFGHMYYANTHRPSVTEAVTTGALDATRAPKSGMFSGNIAGTRQNTVLDQVETQGSKIQNKKNFEAGNDKYELTPPGESYTDFMNVRDRQAINEFKMPPHDAQSTTWAGFQPTEEQVRAYARPHLFNVGDRINITSALSGIDPKDVYRGFLGKNTLFAAPGLPVQPLGGSGAEQVPPDPRNPSAVNFGAPGGVLDPEAFLRMLRGQ